MAGSEPTPKNLTIVAVDKFISATRDSGYSSTASAISELVDNSIQADATNIQIAINQIGSKKDIEVSILDNGCGMDIFTLCHALRFGGSSRFNDRSGLGRFGMGLPNSSLSQARRVTVTSWTSFRENDRPRSKKSGKGLTLQTYLDVDEVASGQLTNIPYPSRLAAPPVERPGTSGTLVHWESCDRLDYKRISTIAFHVEKDVSQRFRYFIQRGVKIWVNATLLEPTDPMFLMDGRLNACSKPYGNEIHYAISVNPEDPTADTGAVRVRFTELPVLKWAGLSNEEKREKCIVNNAGVSVVRAGREVDYGWFFFGSKRKENYDDWWRCEINFDPILDEAFGLTHTKQKIRPQQHLLEILTPDMEATARILNIRAREKHSQAKQTVSLRKSEMIARNKSHYLEPIRSCNQQPLRSVGTQYQIVEAPLMDDCFYGFHMEGGKFILTLDPDHAFFHDIYKPLCNSKGSQAERLKTLVELLLFAVARTEAAAPVEHGQALSDFRTNWSRTIETFIGG